MFVADPNKHDILFDRSGAGKSNTLVHGYLCRFCHQTTWRVVDHFKWSTKTVELELHWAEDASPCGSKRKVAKIKGNGLKVGCARDCKGAR